MTVSSAGLLAMVCILFLVSLVIASLSTTGEVLEARKDLEKSVNEPIQDMGEVNSSADLNGVASETNSGIDAILRSGMVDTPTTSLDSLLVLKLIVAGLVVIGLYYHVIKKFKGSSKHESVFKNPLQWFKLIITKIKRHKFDSQYPDIKKLIDLNLRISKLHNHDSFPELSNLLNRINGYLNDNDLKQVLELVELDYYHECKILVAVSESTDSLPENIKYLREVNNSLKEQHSDKGVTDTYLEQELELFLTAKNLEKKRKDEAFPPIQFTDGSMATRNVKPANNLVSELDYYQNNMLKHSNGYEPTISGKSNSVKVYDEPNNSSSGGDSSAGSDGE